MPIEVHELRDFLTLAEQGRPGDERAALERVRAGLWRLIRQHLERERRERLFARKAGFSAR